MTNLMGTNVADETRKETLPGPDQRMVARCKANGMTIVKLARESGKLNGAGIAMLDELDKWLGSDDCQFAQNGFQGDAPVKFDASMLQDLYKSYKSYKEAK